MRDFGIRLELMIGRPIQPKPAPYEVVEALIDLEVTKQDRDRSGFQITFSLGKEFKSASDYLLLQKGFLDPPNRVIIRAIVNIEVGVRRNLQRQVLIDGIITNHQVVPSNKPGESRLVVTGEDISLRLDLEEKSEIYPNQSDSQIVTRLLRKYSQYGLKPKVTPTSYQTPEVERVTTQQATDLNFIQELAKRNGFIFEIEPTNTPGKNIAYWGEEKPKATSYQPALSMNMGGFTNIDSAITFTFDALKPEEPQLEIVNDINGNQIPIKIRSSSGTALAKKPAKPLRRTIIRNTDKLEKIPAQNLAEAALTRSREDAVTASGEVDTVRYGHILQVRQLVSVRGVGNSYNGYYYVKQVTHRIKQGEYKQSFNLIREGHVTTTRKVKV